MATCSRCGDPIKFRYIDGRCVPLHQYGGCTGVRSEKVTDYSGYNISRESTCFSTQCPGCGDEVFFIRHNGGSVWIDPPLGPPWYKHACFATSLSSETRTTLVAEYNLTPLEAEKEEGALILGVVKSTRVDTFKERFTDISFETGNDETRNIRLKNNAGFLLGKLCVYDTKMDVMWPVDDPSKRFVTLKPSRPRTDLVDCPECGVKLNPKNLTKHLKKHRYRDQEVN